MSDDCDGDCAGRCKGNDDGNSNDDKDDDVVGAYDDNDNDLRISCF